MTVMSNTRVVAIDPAAHQVRLADGRLLDYAALALATGARARALHLAGLPEEAAPANSLTLRTLDDAIRIKALCQPGQRLVVVGGGYIGLELAAAAVGLGVQVTLLEAQPRVLARVTGTELSEFMAAAHRAAGVDLRVGVQLERAVLAADGKVCQLICSDGTQIDVDLRVAGIGVEPEVGLARAAGLAVDNGIEIDAGGRTSAPDIVAAGDCTNQHSRLYGRRLRLESVPNALAQARTAAATLAGKERLNTEAPWFWSDQFDLKLKSVGLHGGHDRTVVRGDPATRAFSVFYLQDARVLAVDTVNRAPDFLAAKRLVAEQIPVSDQQLADETLALKDLLPTAPAA